MKKSLSTRFTQAFLALAFLVIGLSLLFNIMLTGRMVLDGLRRSLTGYSKALAHTISQDPTRETISELAAKHWVGIIYTSENGIIAVNGYGEDQPVENLLRERASKEFIHLEQDGNQIVFVWYLLVFIPTHKPFIIGLLILLGGILFAAHLYLKGQLQPLLWLKKGVDQVAVGNFKVRAPIIRQDEIGQVAQAFNEMAQRIETMMADRERLLADVSHELRSPIARMKVALELIPEHPRKQTISKDLKEMETLISVLLEREKIRGRMERRESVPIELNTLVNGVLDLFADQKARLQFKPTQGSLLISGDGTLLEILIKNLVDNALKFSSEDRAPVQISMELKDGKISLLVRDDGIGVPKADQERIFEPFVKVNPARGHRVGYGLGLNLCMRIVEAHGGQISMTSNGERGACVEVLLDQA